MRAISRRTVLSGVVMMPRAISQRSGTAHCGGLPWWADADDIIRSISQLMSEIAPRQSSRGEELRNFQKTLEAVSLLKVSIPFALGVAQRLSLSSQLVCVQHRPSLPRVLSFARAGPPHAPLLIPKVDAIA